MVHRKQLSLKGSYPDIFVASVASYLILFVLLQTSYATPFFSGAKSIKYGRSPELNDLKESMELKGGDLIG